jgi:hypothetical protein
MTTPVKPSRKLGPACAHQAQAGGPGGGDRSADEQVGAVVHQGAASGGLEPDGCAVSGLASDTPAKRMQVKFTGLAQKSQVDPAV